MPKTVKARLEVDPLNRLILSPGRKSRVPKFRQVIDGRFRIDKNNALLYHIKNPQNSLPSQLKLFGNWSLDDKHNLVLTLDKENNQWAGDKLTLKGELIAAKSDKLEFSLSTKDADGKMHFYILELAGRWQADKHNRLIFLASQETGTPDILTLKCSWEINKKNRITYTYIKENLLTKKKSKRTLSFKGFWQVTRKHRLLYTLNQEMNSVFDFRVGLGRPAKKGLQYEVAIGAVPKKKTVMLSGAWKINPRVGLLLEIPAEEGKLQRIVFGATCKLNKGCNLELKLKSPLQEDLGIDLKLSKNILKNQGQSFVEALKEGKEISLIAGLGFRW